MSFCFTKSLTRSDVFMSSRNFFNLSSSAFFPQLHSPLCQWAFQEVEVQRRYKKPKNAISKNCILSFVNGLSRESRYNGGTRRPFLGHLGMKTDITKLSQIKKAQPLCDVHGDCASEITYDFLQLIPAGIVIFIIPKVVFACPGRAAAATAIAYA